MLYDWQIIMEKYSIIVAGNYAVGKTSIVQRFVYDKYDSLYVPATTGEFNINELEIFITLYNNII